MFNLPLSREVDCKVTEDGLTLTPYDGKRIPFKLTPDETLRLLELLTQNKELIEKELKK